uniref:Ig-like domain-containing protein n=1 Tax=Cyprinus carpio TaxID=7962 RepID=A0A8C1YLF0_CYPCA
MRMLGEVFNLFVCLILSRYSAVTSVTFVENGKNLTLNPNIHGKPEEILWTFNGNKVAEHDLTKFQDYGQFKGRSGIEITTGQLTVRNMTSQDSGIYMSAIQIDGEQQNSENEVQVIDAVQEPIVTCKLNMITESKTLFCSASSKFKITFEWIGSNSIPHSGQELHISKEEKTDSVFTCTVKNEVSQKNTSFTLKDCNTDESQSDMNTILPVMCVIIGAIITGITAVVIYLIHKKINKDTRRSGVKLTDGVQESLIDGNVCELSETEAQIFKDDVNQTLKNNDAENNEEQDINEDAHKSEKNEGEERTDDNKFVNDSQQRIRDNDGENKEQELTDAENMSKEMELDETSEALSEKPDLSDQRSESGKDLHNCEDDEQEISEAQDLDQHKTMLATSGKLNEKH